MRNLKYLAIILIMSLFITSCSDKENEPKTENQSNIEFKKNEIKNIVEIDSYLTKYHANKGLWNRFRAWINAHTGTYLFDGCTGSYNCGPCVGICLFSSDGNSDLVAEDYELTSDEIAAGRSILEMTLIDDGSGKVIISFSTDDNVIFNDNVYISEDINFGEEIADNFGKESFILKKGLYPVSYQYNDNGETVLDLKE